MKRLDKAELEIQLNSKIKQLYQHIESTGSKHGARHWRKLAKQSAKLAESIRYMLEEDPGWEHWWQQYRLENGHYDQPTLYMFAKQCDVMAQFFNYVADGLIKERKSAKKAAKKT
jgi:hypothetical protein